jgi:hypothetical protein
VLRTRALEGGDGSAALTPQVDVEHHSNAGLLGLGRLGQQLGQGAIGHVAGSTMTGYLLPLGVGGVCEQGVPTALDGEAPG